MSKNCKKCEHSNPDDASYCNHCGEELTADEKSFVAINEKDLNAQVYVDEFKKTMQVYADMTRQEQLDKFQKQATSWARFQFAGILTAITALAAFLGFVGFKGIDLQETIDNANKQLEIAVADAQKKISEGTNDIVKTKEESQKKAENLFETIEDAKNEVRVIGEKAEKNKAIVKKYLDTIAELDNQLTAQIDKVNKLERIRYNIQVHYDIAEIDQSYRESVGEIQKALLKEGYVIGSDNIMSVSTDQQEVIYFTDTKEVKDNAKLIQQALSKKFGEIKVKSQEADASDIRDPYKIIVKLCGKSDKGSSSCK